ncbi:MAG: hypothetical protein AMXMBFR84_21970 [Candidatus Hydrogenedentota bacterium]
MSDPQKTSNYRLPVRRPVTTAMIFLAIVVFGWQSYSKLPVNLMPDLSYPKLTVRTEYEGAAPGDVEKLVTRPIEETLSIVGGLVDISSVSSAGNSEVILEFSWGTDMNVAQQDVRDRLDLFDPPAEVTEKPVILRFDPTLDPVLRVALVGDDHAEIADPDIRHQRMRAELTEIREAAERQVKSDLEADPGVAQVVVKGGREKEIQILVDTSKLANLSLSAQTVATALRQRNINLSGGQLRDGKTEYLVRTTNEFQEFNEIPWTLISTPSGETIRLMDVAEVRMTERDQESIVRLNGREAVELEIYKWGDANTVEVCNKLKDLFGFPREKTFSEKVGEWMTSAQGAPPPNAPDQIVMQQMAQQLRTDRTLKARLPEFTHMHLSSDQSQFIMSAIDEVNSAAIDGSFWALAIIYFFLRDMRSTILIGLSIPVSIVATFSPMFMQGISINVMSLGGLAMGVGMLVDNSIVVLESVFRCRDEGDDTTDAANRGTNEVAGAVTASTLTSIAVFAPLTFVEGVGGQLFKDHAWVVTYSLLASLLVALYLIPMIASRRRLTLQSGEDVVWVIQAYRLGRNNGQSGRLGALMLVPLNAIALIGEWFNDTADEKYGHLFSRVRNSKLPYPLALMLYAIPFAVATFLFGVETFIKSVLQVLVTIFFVLTLILGSIFWILAKAIRIALWIPLRIFDVTYGALTNFYESSLRFLMHFSPAVLFIMIALSVHAGYMAKDLGTELIPSFRQGEFTIRMEAPPGTRLEETADQASVIEREALGMEEVENVTVQIGQDKTQGDDSRGENIAEFTIRLRDPEVNVPRQDEIVERLRASILNITSNEVNFSLPALLSFRSPVELQILGPDILELRRIGEKVVAAISDVEGIRDPDVSVKEGYPEVIISLDRELLASKGLTPQQIAERLRAELYGDVATDFGAAGQKIDIRVLASRAQLSNLEDLKNLPVKDGYPPIPLDAVASIQVVEGPSEIRRIDQRQVALVTANLEGRDLGSVMEEIMERVASEVPVVEPYRIVRSGQDRELAESYESLMLALFLAVFLVYVVMASQFESILQPALIMFTVPMAFIGVIYVLAWQEISVSVLVWIGGIVLVGIVVNNAIVLVDYANQLRERGLTKREAAIQAGMIRLRPILMTALTTILGLLPMAIEVGQGAEIRQPLALTIMTGLTSATFLTLYIIPMVYDLFSVKDKKA